MIYYREIEWIMWFIKHLRQDSTNERIKCIKVSWLFTLIILTNFKVTRSRLATMPLAIICFSGHAVAVYFSSFPWCDPSRPDPSRSKRAIIKNGRPFSLSRNLFLVWHWWSVRFVWWWRSSMSRCIINWMPCVPLLSAVLGKPSQNYLQWFTMSTVCYTRSQFAAIQ